MFLKILRNKLYDGHVYTFRRYQQNKGSVLKATIEYIRELQTEYERFEKLEEKLRDTTVVYRGMLSRVQVKSYFFLIKYLFLPQEM